MYCTKCGASRPDGMTVCPNCGAVALQPPPPPAMAAVPVGTTVPNYLVQSILVTLCCCMPAGIVAIVYSAQVNGKLAAGDLAGAQDYSKKAKMWGWIGFGCGAIIAAIYGILGFAGALGNLK